MRIARHVVARKKQQLVALPAEVRRHLGLLPGAMVWWHVGRKGMVALTTSGRVRAGRPREDEDCPMCIKLRVELERLRREVRDGESATPAQFWRQGYARALGDVGNVKADLEVALVLLKQLVARDRHGSAPTGAPRARRTPRARARPVEVVDAPALATGEARAHIDAHIERMGSTSGFGLPEGVKAYDAPPPD